MGLNFYDAWTICKANKGMSLEDYWWLNSGEDQYEKCHIRYLIESGKQTEDQFKIISFKVDPIYQDQMGKPQLEVFNNPIKQLMRVDVKFQTVEKQKID